MSNLGIIAPAKAGDVINNDEIKKSGLGLRRLNISDEKWQMAMQAIGESLQVVGSKEYIRFYQRVGTTDKYEAISLDIASL